MSGHLYQLWKHQLVFLKHPYVRIDGPWDKYGKLLSDECPERNNTYLIRGIGNHLPVGVNDAIRDTPKR